MKTDVYGLTDVGRRRESNEDQFLVDSERGLFAVADGMGGHAAGEVASQLAISTLAEAFENADANGDDTNPDDGAGAAVRRLTSAVDEANRRICETVIAREEYRGMGTTMVAMLALGERAIIGHVGDSRAYLLRGDEFHRLTSDHSWVNEQVKLGLLSDDDAQRHPMRNIVTRALGNRADVTVDVMEEQIRTGDTFLLCSDGLNTMLSDDEIRETLERHRNDPENACRALIDAANDRGGDDNTTVIVVDVH